jgi:hypothetical protein
LTLPWPGETIDWLNQRGVMAMGVLLRRVWPVSSGVPTGPALASETVSAARLPTGLPIAFASVPLSPSASVTAGVQYAIVLSANCANPLPDGCYLWGESLRIDPYPGGIFLWRPPNVGTPWIPRALRDLAF